MDFIHEMGSTIFVLNTTKKNPCTNMGRKVQHHNPKKGKHNMIKYNPTELTDYDITLEDGWGNEYDYQKIISMIKDSRLKYNGEHLTSICDVYFEPINLLWSSIYNNLKTKMISTTTLTIVSVKYCIEDRYYVHLTPKGGV